MKETSNQMDDHSSMVMVEITIFSHFQSKELNDIDNSARPFADALYLTQTFSKAGEKRLAMENILQVNPLMFSRNRFSVELQLI